MSFVTLFFQSCFSGCNLVSIICYVGCILITQITGILWYSPNVFGMTWILLAYPNETKRLVTDQDWLKFYNKNQEGFARKLQILTAVAAISFFMLRGLIRMLTMSDIAPASMSTSFLLFNGAAIGFAISCMSSTFELNHTVFGNRPILLHLIDHGYNVAVFTMGGALLGASCKSG